MPVVTSQSENIFKSQSSTLGTQNMGRLPLLSLAMKLPLSQLQVLQLLPVNALLASTHAIHTPLDTPLVTPLLISQLRASPCALGYAIVSSSFP